MSIFSQPVRPSTDVVVGLVLAVDTNTMTAHVKTYMDQIFRNASWVSSSSGVDRDYTGSSPTVGSQVLLHVGTGRPIILGVVPTAQVTPVGQYVNNISGGLFEPPALLHLNQVMPRGTTTAPSAPSDYFQQDKIHTTPGGTTLAALQHSVMMRAGAQSQILVSKLDDVVRVVGRNWERFSDALTDCTVNFRGRGYHFRGTALTVPAQNASQYGYYEVLGDVVAGENLQEFSYGQPASAAPPADTHIQKEVVQTWSSGSPSGLATKTWDGTTGTVQWIIGPITFTYAASGWTVVDESCDATVQLINGQEVFANYQTSSVTLNATEAVLASNGHAVTVTSGGVNVT